MTVASKENRAVTLPPGVSLARVGQVLLEAWEGNPGNWGGAPSPLREGPTAKSPVPVLKDAMDLFRLLQDRRAEFLLVGGMAMLTYVQGRNTKNVDLLMAAATLDAIPELQVEDRNDFFARAKFRSVQVYLLFTANPLFKIVLDRYATKHAFAELTVPLATVEGMIALKLFALPSLYRQMDLDRVAIYETDITMLLARHSVVMEDLSPLVHQHVEAGDRNELRKITAECCARAQQMRQRAGQ